MKKKYILKIFILISILKLNAQSDFRNGYIINNNKDTIYGLIDYRGDVSSAKKCVFKKEINSEKQIFKPKAIKGYRFIDSKYFISKKIKNKYVFLEYLINGLIDIYYYRDDKGDHYYIDNNSGELHELRNEEKTLIINNITYTKETKEYIRALKYIFKKSPSIVKKIENIKLKHQPLIDITIDYHKEVCPDKMCMVYEKTIPKIKNTFGLIVGLNLFSISENNLADKYYYFRNSDFNSNFFPSIGFYYKIHLPRLNERLFFQYEGTISYLKQTTSNLHIEEIVYTNYYNNINYEQFALNNEILFKYEFSKKRKIRPTFSLGAFFNYAISTEYNRDLEVKFFSGYTRYTEQFNENPLSKIDYGISFGIGLKKVNIKKKELFFDLKYRKGLGLIEGLTTNHLLLNIGMQIGK
jgi:hypothetical protein